MKHINNSLLKKQLVLLCCLFFAVSTITVAQKTVQYNADGEVITALQNGPKIPLNEKVDQDVAVENRSMPDGCIDLPPYVTTFSGTTRSRGYWFTAQSDFVITALRVPNESNRPQQSIQVLRLPGTPPAFPGTTSGTTLFYVQNSSDDYVAANIPVATGDIIGILGVRGPGTAQNSYASAGPKVVEIDGISTTITRFGTQSNINFSQATGSVFWQEVSFPVSRVEICTTPSGPTASEIGCTGSVAYDDVTDTNTITSEGCLYGSPYNADELIGNFTELCGNSEVIAEVTSLSGLGWAGVMMRETLNPGSKKVSLSVNNGYFARREIRTTTNGFAFPQQFPAIGKRWVRLVRNNFQVLGYVSNNGFNWQLAMASNVSMNDCIYVGLFATGATPNTTITATFNNVTTNGGAAPIMGDGTSNLLGVDANVIPMEQDLEVFPNPAVNQLNIRLAQPMEAAGRIDMINASGNVVKSIQLNDATQLDVSDLPAGLYMLRMQSENNEPIIKRVIVQ
jgi:hypothetical protein